MKRYFLYDIILESGKIFYLDTYEIIHGLSRGAEMGTGGKAEKVYKQSKVNAELL